MEYDIFEAGSNRKVGRLDEQGRLHCADPRDRTALEKIVGRELLTYRQDEPEFGEVIEEGQMCYAGTYSVRPTDPEYWQVLIAQLPVLTRYELRPVSEQTAG